MKGLHLWLLVALFSLLEKLNAETWDMASPSPQSYNVAGNWSPTSVPNGVGDVAIFGSVITVPMTVNMTAPVTLGTLIFDSAAFSYILDPDANVLTFDNGIGNPEIQVLQGIHSLGSIGPSPVVLTNNLDILQSSSTGPFTITSNISGVGFGINKNGNATLQLSGTNTYTGVTTFNAGTIEITSDSNLGGAGSSLVFNDGALKITSPMPTLTRNITLNVFNLFDFDSNTIDIDLNTTVNAVGNITGTGTLVKDGDGTLQLSGAANSYSGGTLIQDGTILIDSDNQLGAASGNVVFVGGTLKIATNSFTTNREAISEFVGVISNDSPVVTTWNGAMSGPGGIGKSGTGTLVIGGANTLTEGIGIFGGIVSVSNGSNLGTKLGFGVVPGTKILNTTASFSSLCTFTYDGNGIIDTDAGTTLTLFGTGSGNGGLTKTGTGTLILKGVQTYLGGTTITAGTLEGTTQSLQGTISNSGTLIFDQSFNGTFSGNIVGAGSFLKNGSGNLTLAGPVSSGPATVNAGTLTVNTSLSATTLTVAPFSILAGTGTITAPTTVNGILSPGNSIGTLNFSSLTLGAGSTTLIEIDPNSSDLIAVNPGALTIDPGAVLQVVPIDGSSLNAKTYTIATAAGGVSGSFSSVSFSQPFFNLSAIYNANSIELLLQFIGFAKIPGLTHNAAAVGSCLDEVVAGSDLDMTVGFIRTSSVNQMNRTLLQISGAVLGNFTVAEQGNILLMRKGTTSHLSRAFLECCPEKKNGRKTTPSGPSDPAPEPCPKKTNLWIDVFGNASLQDSSSEKIGYKEGAGGALFGFDITPNEDFLVGLAAGYEFSRLTLRQNFGSGNIQNFALSAYGAWHNKWAFAEALALASYVHTHSHRHITFKPIKRTALASGHGALFDAHAGSGLILGHRSQVRPYVDLDLMYYTQADLSENGATCLNLDVKGRASTLLRTEIGFEFTTCVTFQTLSLTPVLRLAYVRESRFSGNHLKASLDDSGCSFTLDVLNPSRNLFDTQIGLTFTLPDDSFALGLLYEGQFSSSYRDSSGHLYFAFRF